MKLILIHGRAQEKFEADNLKKDWLSALDKGLKKSGHTLPADTIIEFPYYGKLLEQRVNEYKREPDPKQQITRSGNLFNPEDEDEFFRDYLGEIALEAAETRAEKAEIEKLIEVQRGPLNWPVAQKLLAFLDQKEFANELVLRKKTEDVYVYLNDKETKRQVHELILRSFDNEPCVVVAHSLGTVIAYLLLHRKPEFNVKKLITIGSPLGTKAIKKYLGPLKMPDCVKNGWFNAYDDRDYIALNPLDKEFFNISPPIQNKSDVKNHTKNRHGIVGYLDDKEIAQQIYDAIRL